MSLRLFFPGYYSAKIEGINIQKTLSICSFRNILLNDITYHTDYIHCTIPEKQYAQLLSICEKTGTNLSILSKHGWIKVMEQFKNTVTFWIGMLVCIILIVLFQTRIWDIQVDGNIYYDSPVIISFLKDKGVITGMNKNSISCIELADQIRQQFPKIKWTSVELQGTNLIIHIKENLHPGSITEDDKNETVNTIEYTDTSNQQNFSSSTDLIADKDGIIHSIYVRSGIANIKEGDICKKGDVLVKGQIPIYNDSQELVRYDYVEADADIIIESDYAFYKKIDRTMIEHQLKSTKLNYGIQFFDYHLMPFSLRTHTSEANKATAENENTSYIEIVTETNQLKITPTFPLPLRLYRVTTYEYENLSRNLSKSEIEKLLQQEILYFCEDLEKKGVQIYQNNVKMYITDAKGTASGKITVFEKIGQSQKAEAELQFEEKSE